MRGPSDSISVPQVGGAFCLDRRLLNRSLFSEGVSCHPTYFCLAYCKSHLLVWQFPMVLRRREKNGWGGAEEHWLFIIAFDSCWGNGHLTLHNLLLLAGVPQDITPSELTLGSDWYVYSYKVPFPGGSHNCSVNRNVMLQTGKFHISGMGAPLLPLLLLPWWSWWLWHTVQHLFVKSTAQQLLTAVQTTALMFIKIILYLL